MLRLIVILIALLIPVSSHADAIDNALAQAGFIENVNPDLKTYQQECRRGLRPDDYVVEQHKGLIRIIRKPHTGLPQPEFSAGNIKYVSENHGEFGGKLEAVWPDNHKKVLIKENISSIIQAGEFLYVFTGSRHMGDEGAVYRISNFDTAPEVSRLTLLTGWSLPLLDSRFKEPAFIIITNESFLSLNPGRGWLSIIDHHSLWEDLRSNSAVQLGNRILVGMSPGVAVVEFYNSYNLKSIKMFVPKDAEPGKSIIPGPVK